MVGCDGQILILTGPPGAGKTTTAMTLASRPGSPKVHLHADDFWAFIKHGAIAPYCPEAHAQNGTVLQVLARAAEGFAAGGFFVIVDGIVGPWFVDAFRALECPVHYVVLRPDLEESVRRCRARGGQEVSESVVRELHEQFAAIGGFERHALTVGGKSPDESEQAVIEAVLGGLFALG